MVGVVVCVINMLVWVELVIDIIFIRGWLESIEFILGLLLFNRLNMFVGILVLCRMLVKVSVLSGESLLGLSIIV